MLKKRSREYRVCVPLVIGQFLEAVDQNTGIVGSTTGKDICSRRGQENTECSPSHWSVP